MIPRPASSLHHRSWILFHVFCLSLVCHAADRHVSIQRQGLVEGLPAKLAAEKHTRFESSAVICDSAYAWISSDKAAPSTTTSSVIRVPLALLRTRSVIPYAEVTPVMADEFRDTQKIESATSSPEGVTFACTAFDRYDPNLTPSRQYNRLLAWPGSEIDKAVVLNPTVYHEKASSISLRGPIQKALAGPDGKAPPYFKIEGLAALPGHKLWFGIREMGEDGRDEAKFRYAFRILEAEWTREKDIITVQPPFRTVMDVSQAELEKLGVNHAAGVSSLEYDPHHQTVWAVASWEKDGEDGAWLFSIEDAATKPRLRPVLDPKGGLLTFNHKVEGLAVLDATTLLAVSDEDQRSTVIQTPDGPKQREPQMGVWSLLGVE